jgi:drug/metabolite transporter (DMT)-like permease
MNTPALNLSHILWALGIGTSFVLWPIVGKYSQATGAWVNTLVIIGSTVGGVAFAYTSIRVQPLPPLYACLILLAAGALNGAAVYFYSMKAVDPQVPTGQFIMMVVIMMVILSPLVNYLVNGAALSPKQWLGLGTATLSVFLLAG